MLILWCQMNFFLFKLVQFHSLNKTFCGIPTPTTNLTLYTTVAFKSFTTLSGHNCYGTSRLTNKRTRMHSNMMRTSHSSPYSIQGSLSGGVGVGGAVRWVSVRWVSVQGVSVQGPVSRGSLSGRPLDRDPWKEHGTEKEIPRRNMGPETETSLRRNMGLGSQTESDIIYRPLHYLPLWREWLTDRCKNITLPRSSFAGSNKLLKLAGSLWQGG